MQLRTIVMCQEALILSITDGITEGEASRKVGTTFASLTKYKKSPEGKKFIEQLKEKTRQKLLDQIQVDMIDNEESTESNSDKV